MMLEGIYETHVQVDDLDTAMNFYGETLDLELGTLASERRIAFYFVGDSDTTRSMLGVWESEEGVTSHFAFHVAEEHVDRMRPFLERRDIDPVEALGMPPDDQPVVHPWMPAAAIYFEDPAGNQLELLAELSDPPRPDRRHPVPLEEW